MRKPERNSEARYRTIDDIVRDVNLCDTTVMRLASEAEAIIRVGRATRINAERFFDYLEREYRS